MRRFLHSPIIFLESNSLLSYLSSNTCFGLETQFHTAVRNASFLAQSSQFRGPSATNRHYISLLLFA